MTHKIWADFEQQIILLKMREIVYRISPEHNYAIATGVMTTIPAQGGERKPDYKKAYSHFFYHRPLQLAGSGHHNPKRQTCLFLQAVIMFFRCYCFT